MAIHRCSVHGCKAEIVGMDDMPPESVAKVFPWWAWTGRLMFCSAHTPEGFGLVGDVLWRWRDAHGNAANVSTDGALHSHGDIHAVASALAKAFLFASKAKQ